MSEKDIDPQETIEWLEAFRSVARLGVKIELNTFYKS